MDPDRILDVGRVPHGGSDDRNLLDFSANTNPVIPDGTRAVYRDALDDARRYPTEPPTDFRAAAAAYLGCDPQAVIPTPGGLAAIRLGVATTVGPGDSVLVPYPSFAEYAREVRLQGAEPSFVPHDRLLDADPGGHALAIACNPNNPTGDAYDHGELGAFADRCRAAGTELLVDEAFLDFTDRPTMAGIEGTVVARSLTKLFGLPGIRIGFAVATGDARDALATARRPWNVGVPALAVGTHCMNQDEFVAETRERVARERARLVDELATRFNVHPSEAPFLLLGGCDPERLVATARDRGVAIRDATTFRGLDAHVRVAVRLPEENDRLLEALGD